MEERLGKRILRRLTFQLGNSMAFKGMALECGTMRDELYKCETLAGNVERDEARWHKDALVEL